MSISRESSLGLRGVIKSNFSVGNAASPKIEFFLGIELLVMEAYGVKWQRFLTIIAVSVLIALGISVSYQMQHEQSILQIATSPDYCPYEFVDTTDGKNELAGFDIDLARLIAEEMEYTPQFDTMHFNHLLLTLRSQDADFAMAAMTPTSERKQVVNFSSVYYEAQSVIVMRAGSDIASLTDVSSKRIGVKPGTVHDQLASTVPNSEIVPFDHADDALQELKTGRIDVAILDKAISDEYLPRKVGLDVIVLENETPAGVAAAFPKNSRILGRVNRILSRMKRDGTMNNLVLTWFDTYVCPVPEQS